MTHNHIYTAELIEGISLIYWGHHILVMEGVECHTQSVGKTSYTTNPFHMTSYITPFGEAGQASVGYNPPPEGIYIPIS